MPTDDESTLSFSIEGDSGLRTEDMYSQVATLPSLLTKYREIEYYTMDTSNNTTSVSIQLFDKSIRKAEGQMSVFDLEKVLLKDF